MRIDNAQRYAAISERLAIAERDRTPIAPLTRTEPWLDVDDAYAIQRLGAARRCERGARVRGHKVGLTASVMREQFGVNEPDYGHLLDDMFTYESSAVPLDSYLQPQVEIEPAFVLGRRIEGPGVTVADVVRATDCVLPSIEIIDSRIADWQIRLVDTVADNGSSATVVLGGRPVALTAFDPRALSAELLLDGQPVERGTTAAILGNPVNAVAWLANALARYEVALEEGHVVLPGSCIGAVRAMTATFTARFEVLGEVEVQFT